MNALSKTLVLLAALLLTPVAGLTAPPTTFTVNSTADQLDAAPGNGLCRTAVGTCTLRAAIMEANALGGPRAIVLPAGIYTLTIVGANEGNAVTGDLDIRTDLIIASSGGPASIAGAAGWNDRIFQVMPGATVTMTGVRTVSGHVSGDGGAILNQGTLTLNSGVVARSSATGQGGGIHNAGTLTLTNGSRVTENSAEDGGGIFNGVGATMTVTCCLVSVDGNHATRFGGGIKNSGTLAVRDGSRISNNFAGFGGGIHNSGADARLTVGNSSVAQNQASGDGGGILNSGAAATFVPTLGSIELNQAGGDGGGILNSGAGATLSLSGRFVGFNQAGGDGGGISNKDGATMEASSVTVFGNQAHFGGGIFSASTLTVIFSRISNNSAGFGGGIFSQVGATLTLRDITVEFNRVGSDGGGIFNASTLALERSTVNNNGALRGGGIMNNVAAAHLTMTNSTVVSNDADGGAGIANVAGTATLNNVTIAGNVAFDDGGGGIANVNGTLLVQNTILASNQAFSRVGPDCWTPGNPLTSNGFNLIEDTSACEIVGDTTGSIIGQDPDLGPLADNGGLTLTKALLAGSPAVDAGSGAVPGSGGVACASRDQRGVTRPQDGNDDGRSRCDIGAFERTLFPIIGFSILDPESADLPVRERLTYTLTWIVPAALQSWRALETLELRVRDAEGTVFWLRFEEATNTFSLFNEATGDFGPGFLPGSPNRLQTPFATLYLAESAVDGPPGLQVTLTLVVSFKPRAAGRTYDVEVLATDDAGNQQGFTLKGELSVLARRP